MVSFEETQTRESRTTEEKIMSFIYSSKASGVKNAE